MPLNTIPNKGLTSRGYPSDRIVTPLIINGDMSVAQRSTSASSITTSGYHSIDRIDTVIGSQGTWTQSQSTDVPSGQGFAKSLKMDCTTADASPASGDFLIIQQGLEGQNLQLLKKGTSSAESITLSFWVKSNKTGTYILELWDRDNDRAYSQSYTISSASTWEKKVISYEGDTTGAFDNDNAKSLEVNFFLGAGSDRTSGTLQTAWGTRTNANRAVGQVNLADSTSNEWYLTGVQMEVGEFDSTTIPSFPFESFESNLRRCMRYCVVYNNDGDFQSALLFTGASRATTHKFFYIPLPQVMRDIPSITLSGEIRIINIKQGNSVDADDTITVGGVTPVIQGLTKFHKGLTIFFNGSMSTITDTANTGYVMMFHRETGNKLTFDGEL